MKRFFALLLCLLMLPAVALAAGLPEDAPRVEMPVITGEPVTDLHAVAGNWRFIIACSGGVVMEVPEEEGLFVVRILPEGILEAIGIVEMGAHTNRLTLVADGDGFLMPEDADDLRYTFYLLEDGRLCIDGGNAEIMVLRPLTEEEAARMEAALAQEEAPVGA